MRRKKPKAHEEFVVKCYIVGDENRAFVTITTQDEEVDLTVEADETMLRMMSGASKRFFNATVEDGELKLHGEAAWESW